MPERRVIPTTRSTDLVTFKILVDGEELSSVYQVLSIAVEKEINRIPWAKIVLLDGDPASQDFQLSNEDLFIPGKEIEIKAGYHSQNETIFKGIVIRHNLKIRTSGAVLIVECRDLAVKLTVGRKSKYFYESTDCEILEQIIDVYGLDKEVEDSNVAHPEMVQYNVSDWDFCVTRAQANGKICVIDDGKISVVSPDHSQTEKLTLVYGATILDFDAEIDARNQFDSVNSYAWNSGDQELLEIESNTPEINSSGNISPADLASVIGLSKLELREGSGITDAGLQDWADAKSLFNQLSKIRGRVKFQGVHDVKPNTTIELAGVGNRFNGKVYVSAVRHQIAEGNWTCDAQFGINPKWFSETVDINPLPASGLLAAVNGLQIAKVTQLQSDPNGEDRIMVRMPLINNQEQGVWARIATLDAGEQRGSFFRPEIDDEVIVGFLNGSPNDPIVLGMLNSSAKPAPIVASDDNHEKGFVTRSGMKFIFDDDMKSVTLETPAGKIIKVDEDEGTIKLEDENSNSIKLDSDGITMESQGDILINAEGDVKIDGNNVGLQANMQLKVEGVSGAEISSSANTVVKGSMVQIN
ncbi:type VI secretion system tip protein VgrG [Draconibacterium sp. IB214405]|uniref:type VI secretion system tip protein VgrG n=1 Tax=Draconibacterium sp. IB214405 TaxID=3097352 RepID=UPI002A0EB114|nr:type VI secretion system tip protein VgrG [Draconibacterium sp. IB214405]MDX8339936.1 type VI secretion system tip protein VgrG [Draconibacterium sp. IB214405]